MNTEGLRDCQIDAIANLEQSFAQAKPRALIQMATGSGKTYTAVSFIYRLIKFAGAKRVLFLVDRSNLGKQTLREFQQYVTPDDGRKFTELYNVQRLTSNTLDRVSKVCTTTIQRLYSMLKGEAEFEEETEEESLFDSEVEVEAPKDDTHAEDIVEIVRQEFGKGNQFCKKITYRTTGEKPEDLIASFRNSYDPRIAVTVELD